MKALKYLGLTLMLGACTSPQPKDYYEIVGEVKNKSEEIPPVVNQQDAKAEIISQEASTNSFEGIEITLLNSKDGSVLTTVKDIKHINQLKDALKKLPIDKSEPYIHVQLKAGKNTPMSGITEVKQALREHYFLNLNYETNK